MNYINVRDDKGVHCALITIYQVARRNYAAISVDPEIMGDSLYAYNCELSNWHYIEDVYHWAGCVLRDYFSRPFEAGGEFY